MIHIEKAKETFERFVQRFDITDPKIDLKIRHTYGVMDACDYLARNLQLAQTDHQLALLIGLLHDIGRFEQLTRFNSYDDTLLSHAQCGLEVLFDKDTGIIRQFIETDRYDSIIFHAIKNHSEFAIADGLNEQELLHAKLIRDADKLDNFRVKTDDSIPAMLDVSEEALGQEEVTDAIFETFCRHQLILKSDRKTHMDMWISYLAFIFDFNFSASFQYVLEHDYLNLNIDRIPYTNPDTALKMEQIKEIGTSYCKEHANSQHL